MNILIILPWLLFFLILVTFFTQIVIPVIMGRPAWPLFRRESRLRAALRRKAQEIHEEHLVDELTKKE